MIEGRSHDSYPSRDCYCSSDDVCSASTDNKPNQITKDSTHPGKNKNWSKNSLVIDLTHAHSMIRAALLNSNRIEASNLLKMGHELAGRTLRDCGLCAHASFHYAMAWMCDVSDADRAGIFFLYLEHFVFHMDLSIFHTTVKCMHVSSQQRRLRSNGRILWSSRHGYTFTFILSLGWKF